MKPKRKKKLFEIIADVNKLARLEEAAEFKEIH